MKELGLTSSVKNSEVCARNTLPEPVASALLSQLTKSLR